MRQNKVNKKFLYLTLQIFPGFVFFLSPTITFQKSGDFFFKGIIGLSLYLVIFLAMGICYILNKKYTRIGTSLTISFLFFHFFKMLSTFYTYFQLLWASIFFLICYYFYKKIKYSLSLFSLFFCLTSSIHFIITIPYQGFIASDESFFKQKNKKISHSFAPNIYHFLIEYTSSKEIKKNIITSISSSSLLNNFTLYDKVLSNYSLTEFSIPSIMLGRHLNQEEIFWRENNFKQSSLYNYALKNSPLIQLLKKKNYHILYNDTLFTQMLSQSTVISFTSHEEVNDSFLIKLTNRIMNYFSLWFKKTFPLSYLPNYISNFDYEFNHTQIESFKKLIKTEENLSPTGRYNLIYLSLPHKPYSHDEKCKAVLFHQSNYNKSLKCTFYLIEKYLNELKRLKRFNNSYIFIQSDHGILVEPRHRSFLLKKLNNQRQKKINIQSKPIELISITPALMKIIHQESNKSQKNIPLFKNSSKELFLHYHLYPNFLGPNEKRYFNNKLEIIKKEKFP